MSTPPSYRRIAETNLNKAAEYLNSLPSGDVPTQTVMAGSALGQALATMAVAQALLEIGDVLRAAASAQAEVQG